MRLWATVGLTLFAGCAAGPRNRTWTRVQTACEDAVAGLQPCTETTEIAYQQQGTRTGMKFFATTAGILGGVTTAGLTLGGLTALGPDVKRAIEAPVLREISIGVLAVIFAIGYVPLHLLIEKAYSAADHEEVEVHTRDFVRDVPRTDDYPPPPLPEPSALLLPR